MWCTPAPPRPSGSSMRSTKLLVPSGVPDHDNSGDTFSPTQFGFGLVAAGALEAFLGSMAPSLKVFDDSVNTSAAEADCAAHNDTSATPLASTKLRFNMTSLPWV